MAKNERATEALRLLRAESDGFGADLAALDPGDWDRPTNCPPWTVRMLVGHLVRGAESYLVALTGALRGEPGVPEALSRFVPASRPLLRSTFAGRVIYSQPRGRICSPDKATVQRKASRPAAKIPLPERLCWRRDRKSEDPICFSILALSAFRRQERLATLDATR